MNSITDEVPANFSDVYDTKKYADSQAYLRARTRFGILSSTFGLIVILVVIHAGIFGVLDQFVRGQTASPIFGGLLFFGIIFLINDVLNIPFSLYSTFVIEQKFDFNRTTPKTYMLDKLKGYLLTIIFGGLILGAVLYFFNSYSEDGWWIAWLVITVFMIAVQPLFVHVIAPMFNKFTPLEEGDLRTAIEAYATQTPISAVSGRVNGSPFSTPFWKNTARRRLCR
jgi:STE24 endopeptidase